MTWSGVNGRSRGYNRRRLARALKPPRKRTRVRRDGVRKPGAQRIIVSVAPPGGSQASGCGSADLESRLARAQSRLSDSHRRLAEAEIQESRRKAQDQERATREFVRGGAVTLGPALGYGFTARIA